MATNTHTVTLTYRSEGGTATIVSNSFDVGLSMNVEETIPAGATDLAVNCDFEIAELKGIAFGCKKATGQAASASAALTICTNAPSTGTPTDTLNITPTVGVGWTFLDATACPITSDVTALYVSNSGDADADLFVRVGIDPTP